MRGFGFHEEGTFETAITNHLTDWGGWRAGVPAKFDGALGLFPETLLAFLEATQGDAMATLQRSYGGSWRDRLLQTLVRALEAHGTLHVLRRGLEDINLRTPLRLAYFRPASGMNPQTLAAYEANILEVTRQVRHSPKEAADALDLVLSVNGLPIATAELKNPFTGQTYQDAIRQYRRNRLPTDGPVLAFRRGALVHFAMDPDLIFMTTKLEGAKTVFLPFNRGRNGGAGNPDDLALGYRTGWLWHEVWERHAWLDILARVVHLQVKEEVDQQGRKTRKETMIFPRFHQWDAVRKVEAAVRELGAGTSYLVQHSAGSGKSNTIAWLAHRLHSLHDAADEKVFDSVVVITDRRVLDQQLQSTVTQFDHKAGVVQTVDDKLGAKSPQLARALNEGKPIIVCTLQSFAAVYGSEHTVLDQSGKRFAVIVDEAHSSQHGQAAEDLRRILGDSGQAEDEDPEITGDIDPFVLAAMRKKGPQQNLSFFAFTATPKKRTIEVFGHRPAVGGDPRPFHIYSMRQAIEEGFILDVLQRYTTYKTYFRLSKAIEEDPEVDKRKARRAIARFMSLHPHNLAQKTEVMVEHYQRFVRDRIGGRAKAMVVTSSRQHAVRYYREFQRYIANRGYRGIGVLVAFSGEVPDNGETVTEAGLNGFSETELPNQFARDAYHLLIVAEKYQTGFDQPLLHTMYVDKKLAGLHAVQTLSRLNRTHPDKAPDDTFVLDFVNEAEDIRQAFRPFYEVAAIDEPTNPNQVFTLKNQLEEFRYFYQQEVEEFAAVFFPPGKAAGEQGKLYAAVAPAVERFSAERDEDRKEDFRGKLVQYVRLYAMLAQMIAIGDPRLEKLYVFAHFLQRKLPRREGGGLLDLGDDVRLDFYKLSKTSEGSASLSPGDVAPVTGPAELGTGKAAEEETSPLSEIIKVVNSRFETEFTEEHRVYLEVERQRLAADPQLRQQAMVNSEEQFEHAFNHRADLNLIRGIESHNDLVNALLKDQKVWHAL
jgi:type I restriction enzyme R subunit